MLIISALVQFVPLAIRRRSFSASLMLIL